MDDIHTKTPAMTAAQRPASIGMGLVDEKNVASLDAAAVFLNGVDAPPVLSAKQERKLKRKVDLIMIPMVSELPSLHWLGKMMLIQYFKASHHCHTWRG